jgi:hypothetical protein
MFSPAGWEARYARAAERAFRQVPFYREQWAAAGHPLRDPVPVAAAELQEQLFRLCPLARPHRPEREPSLWIGDPADLRRALAIAGALATGAAVLEVRGAIVDWRDLGRRGPRYAPVLAADAPIADPARRTALNAEAAAFAAAAGAAVVVGSPAELAVVLGELSGTARLLPLPRVTLDGAGDGGPALLHDRHLGYLGAWVRACGRFHLDWRHVHARADQGGVLITKLRQTRPTLVNVRPAGAGRAAVQVCPLHGTPALLPHGAAARTNASTSSRRGRVPSST